MPFSSDLFADNDALEPSRTPHIPVSERYSVGGYEVLSGRSGNFSCHTVLSGEVWKMGTEEKLALSGAVREVLSGYIGKAETVLAAGIGNRYIAADCLGPLVCKKLVTGTALLYAASPGTPSQTGLDTAETVSLLAKSIGAELIITVDSLCATDITRLGTAVQINNVGLIPGSALAHTSGEISAKTMPCLVVSLGVPTVFYYEEKLLAPADVDVITECYSTVLASAINGVIFSRK